MLTFKNSVQDVNIRLIHFIESSDSESGSDSYTLDSVDSSVDVDSSDSEDGADSDTVEFDKTDAANALIDRAISRKAWIVKQDSKITKPSASKVPHAALHPVLIRGIKDDITGLEGFAKTIRGNVAFEDDFRTVRQNRRFQICMERIKSLPVYASKRVVQSSIMQLIERVAEALDIRIFFDVHEAMAVGGILANEKYDIHGYAGICVYSGDGYCLLVIEVKRREAIHNQRWYRGYRASQIMTALYHFNVPSFLVSQSQFKVFYENSDRDAIYTFPTARGTELQADSAFRNSLLNGEMSDDFIKALIICLKTVYSEKPDNAMNDVSDKSVGSSDTNISSRPIRLYDDADLRAYHSIEIDEL